VPWQNRFYLIKGNNTSEVYAYDVATRRVVGQSVGAAGHQEQEGERRLGGDL